MNPITYKTSSPAGDFISFLAGVKKMYNDTGRKGVIYHRLNMIGGSYDGSIHPYENENQEPLCFTQYAFEMMKPLVLSQEYIEDYLVFSGQPFEVDFDRVRMEVFTNQPLGSLNRWFNYVFPQMASDLSKSWVNIQDGIVNNFQDKIVINFTQRHRNTFVNYFFLKEHESKIIFAGLQKERDSFCKEWNLDIPLLQVDNFYELAKAIKSCKFFMGNQSFCFQLAESLKTPRILEIFPRMPNVIPVGENGFDAYHTDAFIYYFNKLNK